MNSDRRNWFAYFFGILLTSIFAYYLFDIHQTYQAITDQADIIRLDTGFGALALTGIAPLIALAELSFRRGWIPPSTLHRWGGITLLFSCLALATFGYVVSNTLSTKLQQSGYTGCNDPREISRISRGQSLIFVKGSCASLTRSSADFSLQPPNPVN